MKRLVTRATPIVLILVSCISCSSFNNSFNTYSGAAPKPERQPVPKDEPDEPVIPEVVVTTPPPTTAMVHPTPPATKPRCDVSPYASYPKMPEAPGKEMQEATDLKTVERLERKYIKDLLNYISERNRRQRDQEFKFNDKCDTVVK